MNVPYAVFTQEGEILTDRNGDEEIVLNGFGDSITFGLGDGLAPGISIDEVPLRSTAAGYPQRVAQLGGIQVENTGKPGEILSKQGYLRFPGIVANSIADLFIVMEGANDAIFRLSSEEYRNALQRMVNVAFSLGRTIILATPPPPCCSRDSLALFTRAYSQVIRDVAARNEVPLVDIERAWDSTCSGSSCDLYNVPEGLHPNTKGHDVIGQTVLAALFGIDIFVEGGAAELEAALGLEEGTVIVKPDVIMIAEAS